MSGQVWRFGDAEFDEARRELTIAGQAVELDRNCAAVFGVLLREAGREVPKDRLLLAGWPDRIVHENSLAKAIGRLRLALGSHGQALHTVYGRGYRLDLPAQGARVANLGAAAPSGSSAESGLERATRPRTLLFATVALVVLAAIAGVAHWYRSPGNAEGEFRDKPPIIADAPDAIGRLLWVDDHPSNNLYEKRFFEDHRIAVHEVTQSEDALKLLAMYHYDIVVSDMGRGEDRLAGVRLVEQLRRRGNAVPFVIYTVRADGEEQQRAQRSLVAEAGAQALVVTPREVRSLILRFFRNPPSRTSG